MPQKHLTPNYLPIYMKRVLRYILVTDLFNKQCQMDIETVCLASWSEYGSSSNADLDDYARKTMMTASVIFE